MPRDDESLGEQQTYEGGAQPADSSDRSLGDRSTFGGGADSSLSDIGGLTGDADLDMEIVDLSRYEVQDTLGKGGMGEVLLATDTRLNRKVAIKCRRRSENVAPGGEWRSDEKRSAQMITCSSRIRLSENPKSSEPTCCGGQGCTPIWSSGLRFAVAF